MTKFWSGCRVPFPHGCLSSHSKLGPSGVMASNNLSRPKVAIRLPAQMSDKTSLENSSPVQLSRHRAKDRSGKAIVIGDISVRDVLHNRLPYPLDLESFKRFCRLQFMQEIVDFWLEVQKFKTRASDDNEAEFRMHIGHILANYIVNHSPHQVNLSSTLRYRIEVECRVYLSLDCEQVPRIRGPALFDAALHECVRLLECDSWPRFLDKTTVARPDMKLSSQCSLGDIQGGLLQLVRWPDPVNTLELRVYDFLMTIALICSILVWRICSSAALSATIWLVLALNTIFGPRLDPVSRLVIFGIRPLLESKLALVHSRYDAALPHRIGQCMRVLLLLVPNILMLFDIAPAATIALSSVVLCDVLLVSFFGYCWSKHLILWVADNFESVPQSFREFGQLVFINLPANGFPHLGKIDPETNVQCEEQHDVLYP